MGFYDTGGAAGEGVTDHLGSVLSSCLGSLCAPTDLTNFRRETTPSQFYCQSSNCPFFVSSFGANHSFFF